MEVNAFNLLLLKVVKNEIIRLKKNFSFSLGIYDKYRKTTLLVHGINLANNLFPSNLYRELPTKNLMYRPLQNAKICFNCNFTARLFYSMN